MDKRRKHIAILVSGGGTNLQAIIDAVECGKINGDIKLVVSNRKAAYGLERAKNHNIKSLYIRGDGEYSKSYDKKLEEALDKEEVDLIVLAGYLKMISDSLIKKYENRIINIHPSLIPSFCGEGFYGIRVHEKVIEYGVKVSGATTHFVNEVPDGGPIIAQKTVIVDDSDTKENLQKKVLEVEHKILVESVRDFCDDKLEVVGRKVIKR